MPANRHQRGFTLLELLVSVALSTVILTILFLGLRLAEGAWRRGNQTLGAMTQILAEEAAMQSQVSSAIPRNLLATYEQRQLQLISFRGTAKEIRYLSNYSAEGRRDSGLWLVNYRVTREPDGREQLFVRESGMSSEQQLVGFLLADEPRKEQGIPFAERADDIALSYFLPSSPGSPAAWVQQWKCDERKQLPRGVRIHWRTAEHERDLTLLIPVWEGTQ